MHALSFQFKPSVSPEHQEQLLARLKSIKGIEHLGQIDPSSRHPVISRMCMAEASDPERIDELKSQLAKLPVENVEEPATRQLID
jgi:hypothetical protein